MLFNSLHFLIFFPIVAVLYFAVPDKLKNFWLLAASYYFYMCWNAKYVLLILFSTVVTYLSGLLLDKIRAGDMSPGEKKQYKILVVALSFSLNLMLLAIFKYTGFFLDNLQSIFSLMHISLHVPEVDILLPVGISFYTFQALSYTMDVYRGEIHAEKNFFRYALFVSFFPQLVAGPIEQSRHLLGQFYYPKKFSYDNLREGLLLMIWGFFLKLVMADRIAVFVDCVYGDIQLYSGAYLLAATVLFAVQIYCDFYGYSVIAMGTARIFGISLTENFDAPYLAASVHEFWKRWHISLTSWFRNYLYIPLGGGRVGSVRKYLNKMLVFLVSGLWHGANMSFVVWGGLNGLYQITGELLKPLRDRMVSVLKLNRESLGHRLAGMVFTFTLIDFSWIFFRAATCSEAIEIIKSIFTLRNPWVFFDGGLYQCGLDEKNFVLIMICIGILLFADYCKSRKICIRFVILNQDVWFRVLFFTGAVLFILIFGMYGPVYDSSNFIYFQF